MMERRISVISVNYNGYDLTCAMIEDRKSTRLNSSH